jgi:hypothetical protein
MKIPENAKKSQVYIGPEGTFINSPLYVSKTLIVDGEDISKAIEKNREAINSLIESNPKEIERLVCLALERYNFEGDDKSLLEKALDKSKKIEDAVDNVKFWKSQAVIWSPRIITFLIWLKNFVF